jgi:hypothetical protein
VADRSLIREGVRRRLSSGGACCHSVLDLLPSRLPFGRVEVGMCKTIILPVLCGCEAWSLVFGGRGTGVV